MTKKFWQKLAVAMTFVAVISCAGMLLCDTGLAQQMPLGNTRVGFGQSDSATGRESQSPVSSRLSSTGISFGNGSSQTSTSTALEYDPIAVNGKYFEGWDTPQLALVFTGGLDGYVEPCGCAGMAQMKGGLSRRGTFFKELQAKNWPYIAIDNGGFVKGFGRQEELKFHSMIVPSIVDQMKYDAVGIGPNDLRLGADALLPFTMNSPSDPSVFASANIGVLGFDPKLTAPYRVIDKHGVRIGVTSIIGKSWQPNLSNSGIQWDDPIKRLKLVVPQMERDRCKWLILISHASMEETNAIAEAFPQFGIIVCADTPSEPPLTPRLVAESNPAQYLIEVGEKGKFAIVLGFFESNGNSAVKYQRVAFDSRFKNDRLIVEQMQLYQNILQDELETKGFPGFGINPVPPPNFNVLGNYIGSKKCQSCHEESYRVWQRSGHANAWVSLSETSVPARIYDPECVSCHVVGWNPTERYPYVSGFSNEKGEMTLEFTHVGCENCHGPGEKHSIAEAGSNEAEQQRYKDAMKLTTDETGQRACYSCHDLDNSPEFNFNIYWEKIKHKESLDLE